MQAASVAAQVHAPTVRPHVSLTPSITRHRGRVQQHQQQALQKLADICALRLQLRQPAASPELQSHTRVNLHSALDKVYDDLEEVFYSRRGYSISPKEQRVIEATGGSPTYGELLPAGIDSMLEIISHPGQQAQGNIFLDIGSGLGRVVIQAALAHSQELRFEQLIGIELSDSRHDQALHALGKLRAQHSNDSQLSSALERVEFIQEDATCCQALQQATHVFMCSTAFGSVACRQIVEQLHASPNFQVLVTSRELPFQPRLIKLAEFSCETSWNAAGTGHVYVRRDLVRAPHHLLKQYCSNGGLCWLPYNIPDVPIAAQEPLSGWKVTWSDIQLQPASADHVDDTLN